MAMNNMMTRISPTIGTTFVDSNFVAEFIFHHLAPLFHFKAITNAPNSFNVPAFVFVLI